MTKQVPKTAYLVRGDDVALIGQGVGELLNSLVEDREPSMVVEEHGGAGAEELDVATVLDAVTTPPFLSDRRVVVLRDAGRLSAGDAPRLLSALENPVPGVTLVLVAGGGTVPSSIVKALQSAGGVIDTSVGTGRARTQWLEDRLRNAPVRLNARAVGLIGEHLGGDVSRLRGLLENLASAYGEGASIDEAQLEPFLGEEGSVPPWELTDAVAAGDTPGAIKALSRMLGAGGVHPLAVLAVLHRHYQAMLRLDGSGVKSAEDAAATIGARSVFPARKALEQARQLGSARIGRAILLLADADLDLRGRSGIGDTTVLEVLVGRLSRLGSTREPAGRRRPHANAGQRRSR